jgi:hypothetical protein
MQCEPPRALESSLEGKVMIVCCMLAGSIAPARYCRKKPHDRATLCHIPSGFELCPSSQSQQKKYFFDFL